MAFYDAHGALLGDPTAPSNPWGPWGRPARPLSFVDILGLKISRLFRAGLVQAKFDTRLFHLPIPKSAAFLAFYRTAVARPGKLEKVFDAKIAGEDEGGKQLLFGLIVLGVYALGHPGGHLEIPEKPSAPIPDLGKVQWSEGKCFPLSWPTHEDTLGRPLPKQPVVKPDSSLKIKLLSAPPAFKHGWIASQETVLYNGDPGSHYNIVILGDGFTECELTKFDKLVKKLLSALLLMEPFCNLIDCLNIHVVRTVSLESGISSCPTRGIKKLTYYRVEGFWSTDQQQGGARDSAATYCCTSDPEGVYEAAASFAPKEQIQLFLMLVNYDHAEYVGGSAFPDLNMAFVTLPGGGGTSWKSFVNIAAHECAHVIGELVEEYIADVRWDEVAEHPNLVHIGGDSNAIQLAQASSVWWKQLADPSRDELDGQGNLKCIYPCDPCDNAQKPNAGNCKYNSGGQESSNYPKLGLYWGGQYIEADEFSLSNSELPWYFDPKGKHFFRPMARCKMRRDTWDFCRVCSHLMSEIIQNPWS